MWLEVEIIINYFLDLIKLNIHFFNIFLFNKHSSLILNYLKNNSSNE